MRLVFDLLILAAMTLLGLAAVYLLLNAGVDKPVAVGIGAVSAVALARLVYAWLNRTVARTRT